MQSVIIYFGNTIAMVFLLAAIIILLFVTGKGNAVYWSLYALFWIITVVDAVRSYKKYMDDRDNASGTI